MTTKERTKRIMAMPEFHQLHDKRQKVRVVLVTLAFTCFAFFVGGIAFYSDVFATPLHEGGTVTLGILFTALVIITLLFLEFIYILITDRTLEPLRLGVIKKITEQRDDNV